MKNQDDVKSPKQLEKNFAVKKPVICICSKLSRRKLVFIGALFINMLITLALQLYNLLL